jgi:threonine dehydratase
MIRPPSFETANSKRSLSAEAYEEDDAIAEGVVAADSPPPVAVSGASQRRTTDLTDLPISFADISRAEVAIRGGVKRTSCEKSPFISELVGANVYLKTEFRQFTGSFKERGARNAILQLMRTQKSHLRGVIAASAGNHALALAYHGKELGVPVTVVMPTVAPLAKVDKCRVCVCLVRLCCFFCVWV